MAKKELIAMLLAGGQGSRLGVLTANKAKPSVAFGGKYKIIDFPMSNCINSGIDTVGVLTQYQPTSLNKHIGIGSSWDLDCQSGGVSILSPYYKGDKGEWYTGTANAIYHNIDYINSFNPEYVLILSGDHIYKMDYSDMLNCHKKNSADVTIAVIEVPIEEANRYGIMNLNDDDRIDSFEEKPEIPKSNLASMGIYIFTWKKLKEALIQDKIVHSDSDFGKHIIPYMLENKSNIFAYRFNDYWKDVGTVEAYWSANIDLIKIVPEFNLYDDFWNIYTNSNYQPPQFLGEGAIIKNSLVSDGCYVYGSVTNSILGTEVIIGKNCEIYDCVIMSNCTIGDNTKIYKSIIDENSIIGQNVTIGVGEALPNSKKPDVYNSGITVVGESSVIPYNITIGINCVIHGITELSHYKNNALESGGTITDIEVVL